MRAWLRQRLRALWRPGRPTGKVTGAWLGERRRADLQQGFTGIGWRWPVRPEQDGDGRRNRWLLRRG